jgi:hypothetical protein
LLRSVNLYCEEGREGGRGGGEEGVTKKQAGASKES